MKMEEEHHVPDIGPWRRVRYTMSFFAMFYIMVGYSAKSILSIAIVAMTNRSPEEEELELYNWSSQIQGTILSSFFWGYTAFTFISSLLVSKFGSRNVLLISYLINTIITVCLPSVAPYGWEVLCFVRALQGAAACCILPVMMTTLTKWTVPKDKEIMMAASFLGVPIGTLITNAASGSLASSSWGWPSIFYVFGGISLALCISWYFFGYDSPSDHPYITEKERIYIESFYCEKLDDKGKKTPWRSIFTSKQALALFFAQFSLIWGAGMIIFMMPTYMNDVLNYDIKQNGALMSLPFVAQAVATFTFGGIGGAMQRRNILTKLQRRNIFHGISFIIPAAASIALIYVNTDTKEVAVGLMIISTIANSAVVVGFNLCLLDLAPNYVTIVMGISGTLANVATIIVPIAVGAIVYTKGDIQQWKIVFILTAVIDIIGLALLLIFGKAETEPWNYDSQGESKDERNKMI